MKNIDKFLINGDRVQPNATATHTLINLATENPICEVPMGNEADVNAAVTAAKQAFTTYAMTPQEER